MNAGPRASTISATSERRTGVPGVIVGTVMRSDARDAVARAPRSARTQHVVLLAALGVGRDLHAADEQAQRVGDVDDAHPEVGGAGAVDAHLVARACR